MVLCSTNDQVMGLVGMDDGQFIWKICLSLREEGEEASEQTRRKDTGVKKLLLISVFPDTRGL